MTGYSKGRSHEMAAAMSTGVRRAARSGLLTALAVVVLVMVLVGCGNGPVATSESLTPTAVSPTGSAGASSSGTATPTLMDIVAAETRHFKGDPSAPVTIIEFGDFQ
ncbi:MAG: hypothetical protein GTO49_23390 [Anaerolineae bacterium]|nr:hypothetical protein [Anaerolineae bacterium]